MWVLCSIIVVCCFSLYVREDMGRHLSVAHTREYMSPVQLCVVLHETVKWVMLNSKCTWASGLQRVVNNHTRHMCCVCLYGKCGSACYAAAQVAKEGGDGGRRGYYRELISFMQIMLGIICARCEEDVWRASSRSVYC